MEPLGTRAIRKLTAAQNSIYCDISKQGLWYHSIVDQAELKKINKAIDIQLKWEIINQILMKFIISNK